jgi:Family of unknown function (DUF6209)
MSPSEASKPHTLGISSRVTIRFFADWTQQSDAEITTGSTLGIEYAPTRLEQCHVNWRGADIWAITAFALFKPGDQLYQGSVLDEVREGGVVIAHTPQTFEVSVPEGATELQIWFRSSYQLSSVCEAWDSCYGRNYVFSVKSRRLENRMSGRSPGNLVL